MAGTKISNGHWVIGRLDRNDEVVQLVTTGERKTADLLERTLKKQHPEDQVLVYQWRGETHYQ
jgi:hypothetical protein